MGVLAAGTWRTASREPLSRLLLVLAIALALVGAVAAIGSPTGGAGAVQMLAVCLQVVPFSVVLLAGDLWRPQSDDLAIFTRPIDAQDYVLGRALGLFMAGAALLGIVAAVSVLGLVFVAHLPWGPTLVWITELTAVYALPSLVPLIGGTFAFLSGRGAGPRYHTGVILVTLGLAFFGYKVQSLASSWHPLLFLTPFPGFMTLGLVPPNPLLGAPIAPAWLLVNRLLFICLGVGLLLWSVFRQSQGLNYLPLRSPTRVRLASVAAWLLLVGSAAVLLEFSSRLAPTGVLVVWNGPSLQVKSMALQARLNARNGWITGQASYTVDGDAPSAVIALNAGLHLSQASRQVKPAAHGLIPGTAAFAYRVAVHGTQVKLQFAGQLLPRPSTIPYPPFLPGRPTEGAALGHGRVFLDGDGTWYPRLLGPSGKALRPLRVHARLQILGAEGSWVGAPTRTNGDVRAMDIVGPSWPSVIGEEAPFGDQRGPDWRLFNSQPALPIARQVLYTYAKAERLLRPYVGDTVPSGPLTIALSPLIQQPVWAHGTLWVPGQMFCVPQDPVVGTCRSTAPTLQQAALRLSLLIWQDRLQLPMGMRSTAANIAAPARNALLAHAAVAAYHALGNDPEIAAAWNARAALPVLGPLTPEARRLARQEVKSG